MMTRFQVLVATLTLALLLTLAGCGEKTPVSAGQPPESSASSAAEESVSESTSPSETSADVPASDTEVTRSFGTYTLASGWEKFEPYSTEDKMFYIKVGSPTTGTPDNISVEAGKNRYPLEEHAKFREAIQQQLLMQLKDAKATLNGSGYYTESGLTIYKFTVTPEEDDIVTTQYYIVDDQRFVLVHETAKAGSDADAVASGIVESFVWAEE